MSSARPTPAASSSPAGPVDGPRGGIRWRRVAKIVAIVAGALVGLGLIAVLTAPRWAAGFVEAELEQRLSRRLALDVEIGELELGWRRAGMGAVVLRGDDLDLQVDEVEVSLDREGLWSARFEVVEVEASGGHLAGDSEALEALAERLRGLGEEDPDDEGRGFLRRRMRLTPEALELRGLAFELREGEARGEGEGEARRITGTLAATVEPTRRRVDLRVAGLIAELGLGRPVRAASVRTTLEQRDGPDALRFPLAVDVAGVSAKIDENIAVAGVHGTITLLDARASELSVALSGGFAEAEDEDRERPDSGARAAGDESEGGDLWSISGRFARDLSAGDIAVDMQSFELGRVPQVLARLPLVDSEKATIGGHLEVDFGGPGGLAKLVGSLAVDGLDVSHRLLAREVVREVGFTVDIDAELDPAARALTIERLTLGRGGVALVVEGEIRHPERREDRRYHLDMHVPEVGCQAVLDAIPRELIPGLVDFRLGGQFSAQVVFDADFSDLEALELDGEIDLDGCAVREAPWRASAARLSRGFTHRVTMRDGRTRTLRLFPGSSSYTPLDNISRYMTEAVLTTEDGSFRRHDGFNTKQLQVALKRNLMAGRVRLGASTITMQMVKNVLLSHERTLSRKLQELFSTWWVEQALSKQRIMELYLNVIEFGPGVYGVTNAARHYFGKHPAELTSLEAAYLALMLPSPVRRHADYCNGEISERFSAKAHWIHDLMLERERITAEEHAVYSNMPLTFDLLERGDPAACLEEIEALLAAEHTQRALSGLLGERDAGDWEAVESGRDAPVSTTWGVRPPLPDALPGPPLLVDGEFDGQVDGQIDGQIDGGLGGELPGEVQPGASDEEIEGRLQPRDDRGWMNPAVPVDRDPANADAPGRPAMDEAP
ncbi:transglycosylase domain-containing protein [Pseudenhygromyxa sp. WMMC2535]|uniref:biosynthetic peptidoglycan transglycosylase n=1 Tax=Pseudenhygromyxa sp. WMMC2535 TaxID=2712867 RepID=UPI001556A42F|nr:biosynthetic peptidoglycan transglycosylase [Pseudenhygromyxa sp. WMMC2535]NVB42127.1 transglycosylase domain-containing protein [Pseudenhygromyxa sp. WMMC2535]